MGAFLLSNTSSSANIDRISLSISISLLSQMLLLLLFSGFSANTSTEHALSFFSRRRIIFTMEQWKMELVLYQWVAPQPQVTL